MWLVFAIITVLLWGTSETIFKSESNKDENSVLKLITYNGIVLGICALVFSIIMKINIDFTIIIEYLPVSLIFILSMFFTYKAMKLVKISIISPMQNSSCALTTVLCIFVLKQQVELVQLRAITLIIFCIILLSINKDEAKNEKNTYKSYLMGVTFAIGYWLLDGIGSFLDDYVLDVNLTPEQLIIAFSYIYCAIGIISYIILRIKRKDVKFNFISEQKKLLGTLIETAGQYTYIYTFALGQAAIAAPFIAGYSIVSLILSRIFLKEKLNLKQYCLIIIILISMITLSL